MNLRVLFPLAVVWFMCLLQERSSEIFRPRYLGVFCGLECYTMEFVKVSSMPLVNHRSQYLH